MATKAGSVLVTDAGSMQRANHGVSPVAVCRILLRDPYQPDYLLTKFTRTLLWVPMMFTLSGIQHRPLTPGRFCHATQAGTDNTP